MVIWGIIAVLVFFIEGVIIASGKVAVSRFQAAINSFLLALTALMFTIGYL